MSCCDDCTELGLPVGPQGDAGAPAFLALPFTVAGSPFTDNTNAWVEVGGGRFYFSNLIADPFTSIDINIWVSAGTGYYRIKDLITSNIVVAATAVTSTSVTNIESLAAQSIYNSASALLVIEVLSDSAGKSITTGCATIAYK